MRDIHEELVGIISDELECVRRVNQYLLEFVIGRRDCIFPNWHPLGFVHAKLSENAAGEIFRLHLWLPGEGHMNEQPEKIHDHRFDIESVVLTGGVRNILYKFDGDLRGAERIVRVRYGVGRSEMIESDCIGHATQIAVSDFTSPAKYFVPQGQLHRTERIGSTPSVTLVRTSPAQQYEPRVVFNKNALLPAPRTPIPFNRESWASMLTTLLE
ncbi:hypothetical protein [Burkholderia ubonensis]|uniref:hypothetical protein n=1 Tax=Burkholderia ubonensis TaxID=101571 RepID=UPI000A569A57|nr:hypothetical protein [Burkholderia ubonensis]